MDLSLLDKILIKILNDKIYRELEKILNGAIVPEWIADNEHSMSVRITERSSHPRSILIRRQRAYNHVADGCIHIYGNYKVIREVAGALYDESILRYIENVRSKNSFSLVSENDHNVSFMATVADNETMNEVCINTNPHYIRNRKIGLVGVTAYYFSTSSHYFDDDILCLSGNPSMPRIVAYVNPKNMCNAKLTYKCSNLIYQTLYFIYRQYFENFDASKWKIEFEE